MAESYMGSMYEPDPSERRGYVEPTPPPAPQIYRSSNEVFSVEDEAPTTGMMGLLKTASPVVGLGLDIIGLIGGGIQAYQKAKQDEKDRKESIRRFDAEMAQRKQMFEFNRDMELKRMGLTLDQWKENKARYGTEMKNFYDERNYNRMNEYTNRLTSLANRTGSRMLQLYGKRG